MNENLIFFIFVYLIFHIFNLYFYTKFRLNTDLFEIICYNFIIKRGWGWGWGWGWAQAQPQPQTQPPPPTPTILIFYCNNNYINNYKFYFIKIIFRGIIYIIDFILKFDKNKYYFYKFMINKNDEIF